MAQQFIETVLELSGLRLNNKDLVIQTLSEMMKLQLSVKRNNYTPYRGLSPRDKQGATGREKKYSRGGSQASTSLRNRQQQPRLNRQFSPRQGDNNSGPSRPTESVPGEQV